MSIEITKGSQVKLTKQISVMKRGLVGTVQTDPENGFCDVVFLGFHLVQGMPVNFITGQSDFRSTVGDWKMLGYPGLPLANVARETIEFKKDDRVICTADIYIMIPLEISEGVVMSWRLSLVHQRTEGKIVRLWDSAGGYCCVFCGQAQIGLTSGDFLQKLIVSPQVFGEKVNFSGKPGDLGRYTGELLED